MSRFFEIDLEGRHWLHRVSDADIHEHEGEIDEGRVIYSEADERVYVGDTTEWKLLTTEYDILPAGTKLLMGAFPLPDGWFIDISLDQIIALITDTESEIGTSGGSWTITGLSEAGAHNHGGGTSQEPRSQILVGLGDWVGAYSSDDRHSHSLDTQGGHFHNFGNGWRPSFDTYCIATYAGIPVSDFSASPVSGAAPLSVIFTNLSSNATSYRWNFGDGNISLEEDPTHVYSDVGTWSVSLTATGPGGVDIENKSAYITSTYNPTGGMILIDSQTVAIAGTGGHEIAVRNSNYIVYFGPGTASSNQTALSFNIDDDYAINNTPVDSLLLQAAAVRDPGLIHINGDYFLSVCNNPTAQVYARSFACDSSGQIGAAEIDNLLVCTASNSNARTNVYEKYPNIYVLRPPQGAGGYSTWTFSCDDIGQIGSAYIDRINNTVNYVKRPAAVDAYGDWIVGLDADHGYITTFTCDDTGNMPAADTDSWNFSNTTDIVSIEAVTEDTFVIFYEDSSNNATLATFSINTGTGAITKSFIDTQVVNTNAPSSLYMTKISNNLFITCHTETGFLNWRLQTWSIADNGTITNTPIDTLDANPDVAGSGDHKMVYLGNDCWVWSSLHGTYDLQIRTLRIT